MDKKQKVVAKESAEDRKCPVCGIFSPGGTLCQECRHHKRIIDERRAISRPIAEIIADVHEFHGATTTPEEIRQLAKEVERLTGELTAAWQLGFHSRDEEVSQLRAISACKGHIGRDLPFGEVTRCPLI
ncbi:hypothetical protein M0R72_12735 [Candidatus Pacearchaeota archaeon]|nr:hypothetical protein [Candidatus Pacearchaeota archaeon]